LERPLVFADAEGVDGGVTFQHAFDVSEQGHPGAIRGLFESFSHVRPEFEFHEDNPTFPAQERFASGRRRTLLKLIYKSRGQDCAVQKMFNNWSVCGDGEFMR
jgi:hypothetical protein